MSGAVATTFWRLAGLSYTQYVSTSSACVRAVLKESLKPKAMIRGRVNFNYATFEAGEQTAKTNITDLAALK